MSSKTLSIGELVSLTGVSEPTLRMWERRHGFPKPERTASGHRRYRDEHVEQVRRVLAGRNAGLSLPAAIARARAQSDPLDFSPFATVRRRHPELEPCLVRKSALVKLSHAIEDESLARAERPLLFGCFQRERFYREAEPRWRELAQGAELAAVFADFGQTDPDDLDRVTGTGGPGTAGGPVEIPIARTRPVAREWTLVSYGERSTIALAARERASSSTDGEPDRRSFEMIWTVDPSAVRTITELCTEAATAVLPNFRALAGPRLAREPATSEHDRLGLATAVINRTLTQLR